MGALGMMAAGAGFGAIGDILGMGINNKTNARNTWRQVKAQKQLTDYNAQKQLEMWEKTGYGSQKEQLERAGMNAALMYGMGGGGGQTNSVNAGSVSGGGGYRGGLS